MSYKVPFQAGLADGKNVATLLFLRIHIETYSKYEVRKKLSVFIG